MKTWKHFALIGMMAIVTFCFVGCDDKTPETNPFQGTSWRSVGGNTLTFSTSTTWTYPSNSGGTYTWSSGNTATYEGIRNSSATIGTFVISGNTLTWNLIWVTPEGNTPVQSSNLTRE